MFDWLAPLGVPLIRRAVVTLLVAGATFSLYGVFIITQGLTVIRFSLLHVGLLGSAVAVACGWEPLAGALVAIVLAALSLGPLSERLKLNPGAVSALFMTGSLALAFILFYEAGLPAMEIFSLFAGSVLTVRPVEAWSVAILGILTVILVAVSYRELQAVLYHREFAAALGVPARVLYYGMLTLTGLAIAVAIRLVGALLVDALIILPAMAALPLARSAGQAFALSALFGLLAGFGGVSASLAFDWPIGASVGVAGVVLLAAVQGIVRPLLHSRKEQN